MKEIKNKILDCLANENFNQELIGDKVKLQNKINKLQKLIDVINVLQPLEDEFVLPKKWCVKLTKDSIKLLSKWRGNNDLYNGELCGYLHYEKIWFKNIYDGHEEITFDQFKKYVLNES